MLQVERPLKTFDVLSRKDREPPQYFIGRKFGSFFPKNRGLFFALITVQYQRIRSRTWKILSLFRVHHNPALLLAWWRGLFFRSAPYAGKMRNDCRASICVAEGISSSFPLFFSNAADCRTGNMTTFVALSASSSKTIEGFFGTSGRIIPLESYQRSYSSPNFARRFVTMFAQTKSG